MQIHSHAFLLTAEQVAKLRGILQERGFNFDAKAYTIFSAKKDKLNVSVYEKGPKLLLQGRGIEDFITFILEPEVIGQALLGYDEVHAPELFEPHFGVDESGKGDFFALRSAISQMTPIIKKVPSMDIIAIGTGMPKATINNLPNPGPSMVMPVKIIYLMCLPACLRLTIAKM